MIKCVVWDLDNTLLDGIYLESPQQPPAANQALTDVLAELAKRGILHAVASKNPPEAAEHAEHVTGHAFAAVQCGWGAKPASIEAIMADLGLTPDGVAFVDDDAMERAEVSFTLPDVLVLGPQDMIEAVDWPQFSPPVITDEARRRGELYVQRRARQEEARAFGGSREEFLRYCQTNVRIAHAGPADLPRLAELSVRTHQFNSTGAKVGEAEFGRLLTSPAHQLITVRLSDKFGDDGLVGGCVIDATDSAAPQVPLLMMSCRAMGRGVIDALLGWICQTVRAAGAKTVSVQCMITPRNVPLRIALTGAGFRAATPPSTEPQASVRYERPLGEPLPRLPDWVTE